MGTSMMRVTCEHCNALVINNIPLHEKGCLGYFTYTNKGKRYHRFKVWSLDAIGNSRDGFEVNDRCALGYIMIREDASDRKIIECLKNRGYLSKGRHIKSFEIDGDEFRFDIQWKKTSQPLLQLEVQ